MTKIKAWVQETLGNDENSGVVWIHFPDGTMISCHSGNVESWLATKEITPEETGKYEDVNRKDDA